jgi:hypothetical protein
VRSLDELSLGDLKDDRTRLVYDLICKSVRKGTDAVVIIDETGLDLGDYNLNQPAKAIWRDVVPDAVGFRKLDALISRVAKDYPAFLPDLEIQLAPLLTVSGGASWYRCANPWESGFVGPRASRAVIDREELRDGLRALATEDCRVLIVSGASLSGKSHSWYLIDHLRTAGKLVGHKFAHVSAERREDASGEELAVELADKLALKLPLMPSAEMDDARIRKILNMIAGCFPQDQDAPCWIVLDGFDRPRVHESARDMARRLITMVNEGEIWPARLIVTGFDLTGWEDDWSIRLERIPAIDAVLVRKFLADVAAHLGRVVDPAELNRLADEVLGSQDAPRSLDKVGKAVVEVVRDHWGAGVPHDG